MEFHITTQHCQITRMPSQIIDKDLIIFTAAYGKGKDSPRCRLD